MQPRKAIRSDITDIIKETQMRIKKALVEGFVYHHLAIAKSTNSSESMLFKS